jgi:hypothetical protein
LPENWQHLPIGYHGRGGTVVVSGTDIVRPSEQRKGSPGPEYGPSQKRDFESEVGFVLGAPTRMGERVALRRRCGSEPLMLGDGSQRGFPLDGDEVVIRAEVPALDGVPPVAFGSLAGRIASAHD